jgi:hypothetical protein
LVPEKINHLTNRLPPTCLTQTVVHHPSDGIADSGSSIHCFMQHKTKTTNDRPNLQGLRALQPVGSPIISHTKCEMNESRLPTGATTGHKSPHVKQNFISLGDITPSGSKIWEYPPPFISRAPPFIWSTVGRKQGNLFRRDSLFELGYIWIYYPGLPELFKLLSIAATISISISENININRCHQQY